MPSQTPQIFATWLIGSDPSCDLVVSQPTVSSHHCRLTQNQGGFTLEDLGSTNGTYVDNHRLAPRAPVAVSPQMRITLGSLVPLPWPQQTGQQAAAREPGIMSIGRAPESDIVLDFPMVSWNHARIFQRNGQYILQDLNSRNGTAVGEIQNRITEAALLPSDNVYFGSLKISASRLLGGPTVLGDAAHKSVAFTHNSIMIGRDPDCEQPIDHPMVSWHHARLIRVPDGVFVEDLGSLNGTFVNGTRIGGRVQVHPGQEIVLGNVGFELAEDGSLRKREYEGNVSIQAVEVVITTAEGKRLLDPISLTVYPTELVALMGPAGAGKTTFLKALNGYSPPAQGQVLFNGSDLYRHYDQFRQQMGYVPQDDIVHSQLTVREALYFSTKLRTDLSDAEIEARIDKILSDLGILDKKNSLIGSSEHKVLSGGQRKRVNIALELISDLPVLFLDEPTSGLSSYDAEGVVDLLKQLSQQGKTIITTIHQPSKDVFRKFDNLIMISRDSGGIGALAYFGPAYPDSIKFFQGKSSIRGQTQAENLADGDAGLNPEMLLTGLATARTPEWCDRFAKSPYHQQFVEDRARKSPPAGEQGTKPPRRIGIGQWAVLVRRNLILKIRDRAQFIILLLQAPLFGALIGLVYNVIKQPAALSPQTRLSPAAAQAFAELGGNLSGVEFLLVVAAIWFGCNNAARDVVGEWTIFQRERMVNLKLPSYVFSKFAVLFGLSVFQCLALLTIVYFWCDLKGDFLATAAVLILSSLVGAALGLAISSRSSTTESAIALLPVVLLPIITLGGGIRAIYKMPRPAQLLSYAVPSRWAFEANLVQEAKSRPCGYLPGPERWDSCTTGDGKGVDAATAQVPEAVAGPEGEKQPAAPKNGESRRFSFAETTAALGSMATVLIFAVLGFLKVRDIH
jgi:ABC transport system ATP-binding/permease protein